MAFLVTSSRPSFSAVLRHHKENSDLKVVTIATAFLCSDETAYDLLRGRWDDRVDQIRHGLAHLPRQAADDILNCLLTGTRYSIATRGENQNLDINRDGRVDTQDATDGAILLTDHVCDSLMAIRRASVDRVYTSDESAALVAGLQRAQRELSRLVELVNSLTVSRK